MISAQDLSPKPSPAYFGRSFRLPSERPYAERLHQQPNEAEGKLTIKFGVVYRREQTWGTSSKAASLLLDSSLPATSNAASSSSSCCAPKFIPKQPPYPPPKAQPNSHLTRRQKGRFSRRRRLLQLGTMTATHRLRFQWISLSECPWQLIGSIALHVYPDT